MKKVRQTLSVFAAQQYA